MYVMQIKTIMMRKRAISTFIKQHKRNENAIKFHKSEINALSRFANIHHVILYA